MRINKYSIMNIAFAFFIFMTLNLPSLKLIYSSSILNIVSFTGLIGIGLIRCQINQQQILKLSPRQFRYAWQFLFLWTIMFLVTWLNNNGFFGLDDFVQHFSVILFTFGVLFFINKEDYKFILLFQIIWGTLVAFLEQTVGIPKDSSLGQHYLTSGVAIAATIAVVVGVYFSKDIKKVFKTFLLPVLFILIRGVLSLSGRAPILLSFSVPVIVIFLLILFEKNKFKKTVLFVIGLIGIIASLYVLINTLPQNTLDRVLRIFESIENEPRYYNYTNSFNIIIENLSGVGLTGYRQYGINYPHNVFLEITMSGGLIALFAFLLILKTAFESIAITVKNKNNNLMWMAFALYIFLTWNLSFNLASSYMLFVAMSLFISYNELENIKEFTYQQKIFISKRYDYPESKLGLKRMNKTFPFEQ